MNGWAVTAAVLLPLGFVGGLIYNALKEQRRLERGELQRVLAARRRERRAARAAADGGETMKVLAVIDAQRDFIDGSMGVGREAWQAAKARILALARTEGYDYYVYTQDLHPQGHCSFTAQGGSFPAHCVADTPGADLDPEVIFGTPATRRMIAKGRDPEVEEFGADVLAPVPTGATAVRVDVVGLCYDFCVAACARLTARAHPAARVRIIKAATVAIDAAARPDTGDATVI